MGDLSQIRQMGDRRRRAIEACSPLPPTPTLVNATMALLEYIDERGRAALAVHGKQKAADLIAKQVSDRVPYSECVKLAKENERVANLRLFKQDPEVAVSVNDVARGVLRVVLTTIAEAQLK